MKTEKSILIAFILNLAFSVFEFIGGIYTGSIAIISDAVHDIGDSASIGAAYFLEKKSKKQPDLNYTYGYARYSIIGSTVTTLILLSGSVMMIFNAFHRIIEPTEIKYNSMIIFSVIGALVNFCAAFFTRKGKSLNQRSVNLHMLEDVLGWTVILAGAVIMRLTDFVFIDPIMSICVSLFIFINALKNMKEILYLFLEKTPRDIDINEIKKHLLELDDVIDIHHIHIWSIDGQKNCATMHIVTNLISHRIKENVREKLQEYGISHVTLELEEKDEVCHEKNCYINFSSNFSGHHHHYH